MDRNREITYTISFFNLNIFFFYYLKYKIIVTRERNWRIFSLSGTLETVRGRGVVGQVDRYIIYMDRQIDRHMDR